MSHTWTRKDDILTYYLYRLKKEEGGTPSSNKKISSLIDEIAERQDIKVGSLKMRIMNFKYLDGLGRLSHCAKLSKQVYNEFKHKSLDELKIICSELISINIKK